MPFDGTLVATKDGVKEVKPEASVPVSARMATHDMCNKFRSTSNRIAGLIESFGMQHEQIPDQIAMLLVLTLRTIREWEIDYTVNPEALKEAKWLAQSLGMDTTRKLKAEFSAHISKQEGFAREQRKIYDTLFGDVK